MEQCFLVAEQKETVDKRRIPYNVRENLFIRFWNFEGGLKLKLGV